MRRVALGLVVAWVVACALAGLAAVSVGELPDAA